MILRTGQGLYNALKLAAVAIETVTLYQVGDDVSEIIKTQQNYETAKILASYAVTKNHIVPSKYVAQPCEKLYVMDGTLPESKDKQYVKMIEDAGILYQTRGAILEKNWK